MARKVIVPVSQFLKNTYFDLLKNAPPTAPIVCSICLDDLMNCKNCFCLLNCGHNFHIQCVSNQARCPVCRE